MSRNGHKVGLLLWLLMTSTQATAHTQYASLELQAIERVETHYTESRWLLQVGWSDPRHAFDPSHEGTQVKEYRDDAALVSLPKLGYRMMPIAHPRAEVLQQHLRLLHHWDGRMELQRTLRVRLRGYHNPHMMPFDQQRIQLVFRSLERAASFDLSLKELERVHPVRVQQRDVWRASVKPTRLEKGEYYLLIGESQLSRKSFFYISRIMFPVILISILALYVYALPLRLTTYRLKISLFLLLSLIFIDDFGRNNGTLYVGSGILGDSLIVAYVLLAFQTVGHIHISRMYAQNKWHQAEQFNEAVRIHGPLIGLSGYLGVIVMHHLYEALSNFRLL